MITDDDIEDVHDGKMLNDNHINSASALIKLAFKEIEGLQSTLSSQHQNHGFKPAGEGSIQILHCGDNSKHWVTTCYMDGKIVVYDSLPMKTYPEELNKQLRDLYGKDSNVLDITLPEVQKQSNKVDCGCFAIAWAVLLAVGVKPENITLDKKTTT